MYYIINVKIKENPVYYESLFERLQRILDETKNDWIARKKQLEEFIKNDVETGASNKANDLGLDEKEFAFFEVVRKYLEDDSEEGTVKDGEASYISDETMEISKEIAKDVKAVVKDNYVIDWVTNQSKTNDIQRAIKLMIIKKYAKRIPRDVREKIMEPLLNLAKISVTILSL
mgnify:FL=1